MFTFDNYQLLGDNEYRELEQYINRYLPLPHFMPWWQASPPTAGMAMLSQSLNIYPYNQVRFNRLIWPTSASRFAYIHLLCDSDTVALIQSDAYNSDGSYNLINLSIGNPESTPDGTIISGETISTSLYMLPPTPISGIRGITQKDDQVQSLYLLTCVDSRYMWYYKNVGDIVTFLNEGNVTTWQNLFDYILNQQLGISMSNYAIDYIDPAYLYPSVEMFSLQYESVPQIIDALCMNVGHRFVANFNGTYQSQLYGTALSLLNMDMANNPSRVVLAGGQRFAPNL